MTVISTTGTPTASAHSNQRKVDRTSNGNLWVLTNDRPQPEIQGSFYLSTDDGATWTRKHYLISVGSTAVYPFNSSFFIDQDDYAHVVYKDKSNGYIYYMRGTPDAARTSWTWSAPLDLTTTEIVDYPDVVAHREGAGWVAHIVFSRMSSGANDTALYRQVTISSTGTITLGSLALVGNASYGNTNHKFPSIDFHHTGDGKTVAGGTPHLYVAWSAGDTGAGKGIRFSKATYNAGAWTWSTQRELSSTYYIKSNLHWINCIFDGTRAMVTGCVGDTSLNNDIVIIERDVADTTTTMHVDTFELAYIGSSTYDDKGNVYIIGSPGGTTSYVMKWDRSTEAFEPFPFSHSIALESSAPYFTAKRGSSNARIEFLYTNGASSPYSVNYDYTYTNRVPTAPTNFAVGVKENNQLPATWTHNDPDGSPQVKYRFRFRKKQP